MKSFKTESKRMLDLMINSIYTNREIFLRELISNGSDAIDKLYYKSLTEGLSGLTRSDFYINIDVDKDNRTLKITDNGIGMTDKELENNLGTIAKSGSFDFKNDKTDGKDIDIIGQFGVGFYSAFMVAKKVEVLSKAFGQDNAFKWVSDGAEGYDILPATKETNGTEITIYLKDNTENDNYDEFLQEYKLKELIKKYSDYIRYPIKMLVTTYDYDSCECEEHECECDHEHEHQEPKEVKKVETINSMTPVWRKTKAELNDGEYEQFYKDEFYDGTDPIKTIFTSNEGLVDYKALLFIPKNIPFNYYTKNYEKGLKLYTSGVMITDKCGELLPDYFNFVKGVVDSELTLNISRETVQQNRQLKVIAQGIEKKIKSELVSMLKNEREKYEEFFDVFGASLKYGIYSSWGRDKDKLIDLIMFKSAKTGKYITFDEYIDNIKEGQKVIYYSCGKNVDAIKSLPRVEGFLDKGLDVLCLTEDIDEFAIKMIGKYKDFEIKSIESDTSELEDMSEQLDKTVEEKIMKVLDGKVVKVKGSKGLKNHPVALTSEGELSIEMEKVLSSMPGASDNQMSKAQKVLEINVEHKIYQKLLALKDDEGEKFNDIVNVLYGQAMLIAGLNVDDISSLTDKIFSLID